MNDMSEESNGCPSLEALAEYVDFPESEEIKIHLQSCVRCRKIYSQHVAVAKALQSVYAPPSDIEQKIKAACCKAAQQPASGGWRVWWGKAAAIAAIAAICFLTGIYSAPGLRLQKPLTDKAVALGVKAETVESVSADEDAHVNVAVATEQSMARREALSATHTQNKAFAASADEGGALAKEADESVDDFDGKILVAQNESLHNDLVYSRPVAAIDAPSYTFVEANGATQRVGISERVSHVWKLGKDCDWRLLVRDAGGKVVETDTSNDAYDVIRINGADAMVQRLVDALHRSGAVLYSAEYPQPGRQTKTFFADSLVDYEMKILK